MNTDLNTIDDRWPGGMSDTDARAEQVLLHLMGEADFQKRFDLMNSLSRTIRDLSRRAITRANPEMSERDVDFLFVEYHYGAELANKLKVYTALLNR